MNQIRNTASPFNKFLRNSGFVLLLFFIPVFCIHAQQVNFRNYSVGEGLAQSQVFAMLEDDRGYLWFGTRGGGLSVFDGRDFRNFTSANGLANDFVYSLHKDKKGNICIGTNGGLSIYDGKKFKNYFLKKDSVSLGVNAITEDASGNLWLATPNGIYLKKGEDIVCYSCKNGINRDLISCLFFDSNGTLWFGDDFGLNRIDTLNGKVNATMYRGRDGFTNVLVRVIAEPEKNWLLIGTYGGGLFLFNNGKAYSLPWNEGLESKIIHDIRIDKKKNWWIATYDAGVYRLNRSDSIITHFTENEGLANNHVSSIFEDSWGNIWLGTSGGGVSKYSGEQFMHYTEKNGLIGNYVYAICPEGDSVLWMGTSAKGVIRMNMQNGRVIHYTADSGFVNEKVKSIYCDTSGSMYFGTEGEGFWMKDSSGFQQWKTDSGLSSNWIKDILVDAAGNTWLATAGGGISVIRRVGKNLKVEKIREADGLAKDRVNCLLLDKQNRIWYGTEGGGIGYVSGERIKNFGTNEGLSGMIIRSIREDRNGFLWVATGGGGLSRMDIYRSMRIERVTKDNGLTSDNLYLLEIDDQNNLWAGSESGVDRIILNENSEVTEIRHYGKTEGFLGIETCQNAVCKTSEGSIWFGTINGLTRHNPRSSEKNNNPPRLHFTTINLFYQPLSNTRFAGNVGAWGEVQDHLVLDYTENHLGFEFIGIDQRNPTSVKYQWKLEGFDPDWSPLSIKHDVTYSNLPPGEYTFLFRARNEDGIESTAAKSFSFTIEPPVWQRWWFRLLMYSGIALLIALVVYLFTRRSRLRNKAFRERLKIEKRMVELEQKALRLQMNPHFIFHALNSIQGLIVQKDEKTARMYLSKFSKLMRAILENSREQVITLDKEIITLEDYLSLEKFTRNDVFDYSIVVNENVDTEVIMIPSMLLQPFVENSIIHGFTGLTRRAKLEIIFEVRNNTLYCRLRDNGIGRKKATENKAQRDAQHKSMALIVTQERLDLINREADGKESGGGIEIIDLFDENGEPAGTEVIVKIVLES